MQKWPNIGYKENKMFMILYGFLITLVGYLCAKPLNRRFPQVPLLVFGMFIVIGLLSILKVPYEEYRLYVNDLFSHLLGYVTVALAIPLNRLLAFYALRVLVLLLYQWDSLI